MVKASVGLTFVVLVFYGSFGLVGCVGGLEIIGNEWLYVGVNVWSPPFEGAMMGKRLVITFNHVNGLPVNSSLPVFGEYFHQASYETIPWGAEGEAVRVTSVYDASIGNETAERNGVAVGHEFLSVFGQSMMPEFDRIRQVDNVTNTITVMIYYGYFHATLEYVEGLLKYMPTDGFGKLINRNLLSWLVPGNISCGCDLLYTMYKTDAATFSWSCQFFGSTTTPLKKREKIDLAELLNCSSPIEPSSERRSRIMLDIEKTATYTKKYVLSLESITPAYTNMTEDKNIIITYELDGPVDDVIAWIIVNIETSEPPDQQWAVTAFQVVGVGLVLSLFLLGWRMTRKNKQNKEENAASCPKPPESKTD